MIEKVDEKYMERALELAYTAEADGEVPIGAVIVYENEIIAQAYNRPISTIDPTAHAEIVALRIASKTMKNYRLLETTVYVTLEPCAMCLGALFHARIKRLVFGAYDKKAGACGSKINMIEDYAWNHLIDVTPGVLELPCREILQKFFKARR